MAKNSDEWRSLAITAVFGLLALLLAAWLTGLFSSNPQAVPLILQQGRALAPKATRQTNS